MAPVMIIPLQPQLPTAFSDLPESFRRATLQRSPIWSCSGWGLPSFRCHHRNWWALTSPFHPYQGSASRPGGLFSVALSLGSPPLGVTQHPALWSSDFPLAAPNGRPAIIWPTPIRPLPLNY